MLLTQLEYFVAVAREQHFGRAAAASFVSPSTLSEAIRKLEIELGVPLVHRGRTFQGLTAEGDLVLVWAQRMLADHRSLADELSAARERLAARARFGVIPSGVAFAAAIVSVFGAENPFTRASMTTGMTSEEIVARLRSYELDAGVIHPSAADGDDLLTIPIHEDRAVVAVGDDVDAPEDEITGEQLAELPLCLLEPHMRARQIFDAVMSARGLEVSPRFETDSVESLVLMVRTGPWAAVVPESMAAPLRRQPGRRVLSLVEPTVVTPMVLARLADEPTSALAAAIDAAAVHSLR